MWKAIRHHLGLQQTNGVISWCEINEEATMYKKKIDGLTVGTHKSWAPSLLTLLTAH